VSSEKDYDVLYFVLDNNVRASISGTPNWQDKSEIVVEGDHSAAWCYSKDKSLSGGQDRGEVGNIRVKAIKKKR